MRIAFRILDKTDNTFKKVYFADWDDQKVLFNKKKNRGKFYLNEKAAQGDIEKLKTARSATAMTLSIILEEE